MSEQPEMFSDAPGRAMPRRPAKQRATDAQILDAYQRTGNIWEAAKLLGLCGQSVQERLVRLGVDRSNRPFTDAERERIRLEYLLYRDAGKLSQLALSMERTKPTLCREARKLGLTDQKRGKFWDGKWKYMTEDAARVLFERFKGCSMTMGVFCTRHTLDDLSFSNTMRRYFPDEWDAVIEAKAPRQTMYRLGRAFEYRVRDALKKVGFFVLRSPRSGSPIDLVAIRKGLVLMIQCKRSGQLGIKDWNAIYDIALSSGAVPIMAEMKVPRGILCWRMTDRKDGTRRAQPMEPYEIGRME